MIGNGVSSRSRTEEERHKKLWVKIERGAGHLFLMCFEKQKDGKRHLVLRFCSKAVVSPNSFGHDNSGLTNNPQILMIQQQTFISYFWIFRGCYNQLGGCDPDHKSGSGLLHVFIHFQDPSFRTEGSASPSIHCF